MLLIADLMQQRGNKDGRTQVTRSPERSATLLYRTPVNGTTHDGYHALEGAEVVSATAAPPAAKIGISTVGQQNVVLPGRPPARSPLLQQFDGSGAVALDYNSKDIDGHDSSDARAVPPQVPQLRSPDPPRSNSNPAAANVHATHATSGNQMPDTLHHTSTCGSQLGQGRQATSKGVSSGFGSFKQLSARLSASAAAVFNLRRGRSCE
ncbi:hypothetical protein GY45DRAFT_842487 [Cubamyces sp. BRFM 1775]|nr:hypothetical protein GY45DRAFT_842487 [Cubamyces sp. BRFM 1775]